MKPKAGSHIKLEGSGKSSRRGKRKAGSGPDNEGNLRAWRIGLIKTTWERVVERQMGAME